MPLYIVVGAQFGGEGKGLITASLALHTNAKHLIKTGGPNSSHTYEFDGTSYRVRMLPSGSNLLPATIYFPSGCLLQVNSLLREVNEYGVVNKIIISPNAGIIEDGDIQAQKQDDRYSITGSTRTGTGTAIARRSLKRMTLACDIHELRSHIGDVEDALVTALGRKEVAIAEGSQAYGLSNYHGLYPFVTSRDTTCAAVLSQIGLGYKYTDRVILVVKAFPTRNSDNTAPFEKEISDGSLINILQEIGGGSYDEEMTLRRFGFFSWDWFFRACRANSPTDIAVTGLDKLASALCFESVRKHYGSVGIFINELEKAIEIPVSITSKGRGIEDVTFDRSWRK